METVKIIIFTKVKKKNLCGEVFIFITMQVSWHCSILSRGQTDKEHYVILCTCGEPGSFITMQGSVTLTRA
jgi:hypothetical protein